MSDKARRRTPGADRSRRRLLLGATALARASSVGLRPVQQAQAQNPPPAAGGKKPNILVIFGDDIGQTNISAYSIGLMGYRHPTSTASPTKA